MLLPPELQAPAHRPRQEQDHNDSRSNPEGPVQIWVALEDVEKVATREDGGAASSEDFVGVDVEELCVEVDGPEVFLGLEGGGRGRGALVGGADLAVGWGAGFVGFVEI